MFFANLGIAQSSQTGNPAATAVSLTRSSAHEGLTDLQEINRKANLLLNELRDLLKDPVKEAKFREGSGASIIDKAGMLCPSVVLKHLLIGDERTDAVGFAVVEEGKNFVSLLSVALNELAE